MPGSPLRRRACDQFLELKIRLDQALVYCRQRGGDPGTGAGYPRGSRPGTDTRIALPDDRQRQGGHEIIRVSAAWPGRRTMIYFNNTICLLSTFLPSIIKE